MENPYNNQYPPPGNQYPPQGPPPPYWQYNPYPPPPGPPPQTSLDLWKVVGINFGVFFLYQTMLALFAADEFLVLDMFPLIIHWLAMLVLMIISFSRRKKMYGLGHLISLILIIMIGFGSCFLISDLLGGMSF